MTSLFYSPSLRGPDEDARQSTVDATHVFDHADDPALQAIVARAAWFCRTPVAAISIVDQDRQWFAARFGIAARETPRAVSFCGHAMQTPREVFCVLDASSDRRFAGNPLVQAEPGIRFYAGAPLVASNGVGIGSLCVIDKVPRRYLADRERRMLLELAGEVMNRIGAIAQRVPATAQLVD